MHPLSFNLVLQVIQTPAKGIKKVIKIGLVGIVGLLLLPVLLYLIFLIPVVQTLGARWLTAKLFSEYGVQGKIGRLYFKPVSSLVLEELFLPDTHGDTLFYVGNLEVRIGAIDFSNIRFGIDFLKLEKARWFMRHHKGEPNANMQFIFDKFSSDTPDTSSSTGLFILRGSDIEINDMHYVWRDEHDTTRTEAINWSDLDVRVQALCVQKFELAGDTIRADIQRMILEEKSGFIVRDFIGYYEMTPLAIGFKNMEIQTNYSRLKGDFLMIHNHYEDFDDFLNKVHMDSYLRESTVDARDIAFFTDELKGWQQRIDLTTHFAGTVSNFAVRNLELKHGRHTYVNGKARVRGLPDIEQTFFHFDFNEFNTTATDIRLIQLPPFSQGVYVEISPTINDFGQVKLKGDFMGTYFDFVANINASTALGKVRTDIQMNRNPSGMYSYAGNLRTQNFRLGKLLGDTALKSVTLTTDIVGSGFTLDELQAELSGSVHSLTYLNYTYSDIKINGKLAQREFEGKFDISDPNASLRFDGLILLAETPRLRFEVDIDSLKPAVLGFLPRDSSATLYGWMETDITNLHPDSISGTARLHALRYKEKETIYEPGDIFFRSSFEDEHRQMEITGPYITAIIKGEFTTSGLVEGVTEMVHRSMPKYLAPPTESSAKEVFSWFLHLEKTKELFGIFLPDITTDFPINLRGIYNGQNHSLSAGLSGKEITAYGIFLEDIQADIALRDSMFLFSVLSKDVVLSSTGHMADLHLDFAAKHDSMELRYSFHNKDSTTYAADVTLKGSTAGPLSLALHFDTIGHITLADTAWKFNNRNQIIADTSGFVFENLQVLSGNKYLSINGRLSENPKDKLGISFSNFNLANISNMFPTTVDLGGNISGFVHLSNLRTTPGIDADLSLERLVFNGEKMGDGQLKTHWDSEAEKLDIHMDMHSVGSYRAPGGKIFLVEGNIRPFRSDSVIDLKFRTDGLKLGVVEPFINSYVSNMRGHLKGHLQLTGTFKQPKMSGNMQLDSVGFKVNYLNTGFYMHGQKLRIEEDFFGFDQLTLLDEEGNKASANITVFHDNFRNINFDISFDTLYRFLCLNTSEKENPFYYGKAYLSGHMSLSGDMNNMWIEIVGATNEKSNFFLPLYGDEVSENEYITFVNPTLNDSLRKEYAVDFTGINMNIALKIHPATEAALLFDPVTDDALKVKGSGDLIMRIDPKGNFAMDGLYTIRSGTYKFTAERILTKTFKLEEGGTIRWNGDPLAAILDVTAVYRVRAPLGSLFNDPAMTQKVNNDCKMNLKGPLESPSLKFNIELLNVDEATKQQVRSQMPTQEDIDKQFFNLMLFSRYAPASEGVSSDGLVSTSSSDLLAGQINSILSKFNNNLIDFGVSELKSSQVEVELSKSLFNDRVHFESNVGMAGSDPNKQTPEGANRSSFIGDFTLEYLIREDGKLRAKVFSRAETRTIEYESSGAQTQGVGLFFREEFNTYGELLRRAMFWKRRKKE